MVRILGGKISMVCVKRTDLNCIIETLRHHALTKADQPAFFDRNSAISYCEFDVWTDGIAHTLAAQSSNASRPIVFFGTNGMIMIATFVACMKLGRAFCPINRDYPTVTVLDLINRIECDLCVTDTSEVMDWLTIPIVRQGSHKSNQKMQSPLIMTAFAPESNAVLHCSSGSTGIPKLIPYTARMEAAFTQVSIDLFELGDADVVAHVGTFWMETILAVIAVGAKMACYDIEREGIKKIAQRMRKDKVTVLPIYPALFRILGAADVQLPKLRVTLISGEPLSRNDVKMFDEFTAPDAILVNVYASMELTYVTQFKHRNGQSYVGDFMLAERDVAGIKVEVTDSDGALLPAGEIGEIRVRSNLLPKGYIGDPLSTARVFPYVSNGLPCYRTGDLGYFDAAGMLYYVGRIDDQLRVGGFNVRMSVVEAEMLAHPDVKEAAVIGKSDNSGRASIHGIYVGAVSPQNLRTAMALGLPRHSIPVSLTQRDTLPKTVTGKLKRKELVPPDTTNRIAEAFTGKQAEIANLWQQTLGHTQFGVTDNFFDLGGDSLRAIELMLYVEQSLGPRISLDRFVLAGGTIDALASLLDAPPESPLRTLKVGRGQHRIYVAHGWDGGVSGYIEFANGFDRDTEVIGITADYTGRSRAISVTQRAREALTHLPQEDERTIIGYSYAGSLALEIARLSPQTRTRLVLIDPYSTLHRRLRLIRYFGVLLEEKLGRKRPLGMERRYIGDWLYRLPQLDTTAACLFYGDDFRIELLPKWTNVTSNAMQTFEVSGSHARMMRGGSALRMADQITHWLRS